MIVAALFFYLFACICVASAFMVIASRNPVHSVLYLILAFVNAAGLFVMMGAEFLAMILIVVYVGAVAVLFLFVVMMLDVDFTELKQGVLQYLPIGVADRRHLPRRTAAGGRRLDHRARHPARHRRRRSRADITNTEAIGLVLYTKYVYFFEAAGMILLVAMVGAIVLTLHHRVRVKRQSIAEQVARTPETCIEIRHVRSGPGPGRQRMTIGLGHYLSVAAILFTLGIFGIFLNRKNVIIILMSIELILLAVNINLVAFSDPSRRHRRPGLRAAGADGGGGGSGHRACHPGRVLPQPRLHRGRRHQSDEGLRDERKCIKPSSFCRCSAPFWPG